MQWILAMNQRRGDLKDRLLWLVVGWVKFLNRVTVTRKDIGVSSGQSLAHFVLLFVGRTVDMVR